MSIKAILCQERIENMKSIQHNGMGHSIRATIAVITINFDPASVFSDQDLKKSTWCASVSDSPGMSCIDLLQTVYF